MRSPRPPAVAARCRAPAFHTSRRSPEARASVGGRTPRPEDYGSDYLYRRTRSRTCPLALTLVRKCRSTANLRGDLAASSSVVRTLRDEVIADDERVQVRDDERLDRDCRILDDRLALEIEGRVEQDWQARELLELLEQSPETRVLLLVYRLESGRAVHVSDRAEPVTVLGSRLRDEQHVGVVALLPFCDLEVLARGLGDHRRSERPELLPLLDQLVDVVPHPCVAWIAEDAPVPESPRPEFEPPLRPGDDLSGREPLGRDPDQLVEVVVPARRDVLTRCQRRLDRIFCQVRPPVRHFHSRPPIVSSERVMDVQRRAERRPVVGSSRLHKDVVKHPAVRDESVHG